MRLSGIGWDAARGLAAAAAVAAILASSAPTLACPYDPAAASGRQPVAQATTAAHAAAPAALAQVAPRPVTAATAAPAPRQTWWRAATAGAWLWLTRAGTWARAVLQTRLPRLSL